MSERALRSAAIRIPYIPKYLDAHYPNRPNTENDLLALWNKVTRDLAWL